MNKKNKHNTILICIVIFSSMNLLFFSRDLCFNNCENNSSDLNFQPLESTGDNIDVVATPSAISEADTVLYDLINHEEIHLSNSISSNSQSSNDRTFKMPYEGVNYYLNPETVFPPDTRQLVGDTTGYPWRTIVHLSITTDEGPSIGSGAMIDETHVLTAAHCVYNDDWTDSDGWANSIVVTPGLNGAVAPYGTTTGTLFRTFYGWVSSQSPDWDLAVITLAAPLGNSTGWMGLKTADYSDAIYTSTINTAGYPGDMGGNYMYYASGTGDSANDYRHWYPMDTYGGQSGSPVWQYTGDDRYIISVHAYGEFDNPGCNSGTRIDQFKFTSILNWLEADFTSTDYPDMITMESEAKSFSPGQAASGITYMDLYCYIANVGTSSTGIFTVSFYASTDTNIDNSTDYFIGTDSVSSISTTRSSLAQWTGTLPGSIPSGTYYIGWIIDVADLITEWNEDNNKGIITSSQLVVDAVAPNNPTTCEQTIGTTSSGAWQNSVNNPNFAWSGASDPSPGTGIDGYYYYWGTSAGGTGSAYRTSTSFSTSIYSSGTYYFRIRTQDNVDNLAEWTTLYEFYYDSITPSNPISCEQTNGTTTSDQKQESISNPSFTWSGASDSHSGIDGYYYYWGTDPAGTSTDYTSTNQYDPDAVDEGTYYLRVRTQDNATNLASSWKTIYIFIYDVPNNEFPLESIGLIIVIGIIAVLGVIGVIIGVKIKKTRS